MVHITVNETLKSQLIVADEPVELRAKDGRLLGRFIPAARTPRMHPEDRCPLTEQELREVCAQPFEGRPLAEIWKDLDRT